MRNEALRRIGVALLLGLWCCLNGARAHHSTAAEFDQSKPVTFTGAVQKVVWLNPHIYTYVEVKQPGAASVIYHVEGGAPNALFRQGWRKDSIKVGDVITVSGWRAKNPESMNVGQATLNAADGKQIFRGDGPAKSAGD